MLCEFLDSWQSIAGGAHGSREQRMRHQQRGRKVVSLDLVTVARSETGARFVNVPLGENPSTLAGPPTVSGRKHQVVHQPDARDEHRPSPGAARSIDTTTLVGLRDRALFGTLCYTGARIGAVVHLKRGDLQVSVVAILATRAAVLATRV